MEGLHNKVPGWEDHHYLARDPSLSKNLVSMKAMVKAFKKGGE